MIRPADTLQVTLGGLLAQHSAHCPALVRGTHHHTAAGEHVYELRCPACGRVVAHVVLDPRGGQR